jgi:hypothetical protein
MPLGSWDFPGSRHRGARCSHARQTHPLHPEALLICAWPDCNEGTARTFINVAVERSPSRSPSRIVQFDREPAGDPARPTFRWSVSCP